MSRSWNTGVLERLEARALLSGYVSMMPEGYVTQSVHEVVELSNLGNDAADFELIARYERGFADQVVASGTLAPETRRTIVVSDPSDPGATVVRSGEPFSLVLEMSERISASLTHTDHGSTVSMPFTEREATWWSFPEVRKESGETRDFVLVYNNNPSDAEVWIYFHDEDGMAIGTMQTVGAFKRGGFSISDMAGVPDGVWAVSLESDRPIVASQSSYGLVTKKSYGIIGASDHGSTAGVVPVMELATRTADADSNGAPLSPSREAVISILNMDNANAAQVTLRLFTSDGSLLPEETTIAVAAFARATVSLASLSLPDDFDYSLAFESDRLVAVLVSSAEGTAGGGVIASQVEAGAWDFASGYMNQSRAGDGYFEGLSFFNDGSASVDVNIDLLLEGGQVYSLTTAVEAGRGASVPIHLISDFVDRAVEQTYSIRVSSSSPIIAAYRRWDAATGLGFVTLGVPGAATFDLQ